MKLAMVKERWAILEQVVNKLDLNSVEILDYAVTILMLLRMLWNAEAVLDCMDLYVVL